MNKYYSISLTDTVWELIKIQENIYNCIFEVAMAGELAEWNSTIEIGDTIKFSLDIFQACSDSNVQLLIKLLKDVEQAADSLMNINALDL